MKSKREKYRKAVFIVVYRKENIRKSKISGATKFKKKKNFVGNKIKYLILKRKLHWRGWEFPKGGKKILEGDEKAVRREIFEETGEIPFNIKKFNIIGRYKYSKKLADRKDFAGQTYRLYSAEIKNEKIKIDRVEHSSCKWVNFKEATRKLTYNNQRKCLKIVNSYLLNEGN